MGKDRSSEELQETPDELEKHITFLFLHVLQRMQIEALHMQQGLFKLSLQELPEQRKTLLFTLFFGFIAVMSAGVGLFVLGRTLDNQSIIIASGVIGFSALGGFIYLLVTYKHTRTEKKVIDNDLKKADENLELLKVLMSEVEEQYELIGKGFSKNKSRNTNAIRENESSTQGEGRAS